MGVGFDDFIEGILVNIYFFSCLAVPEADPPIDTNLIEFDTRYIFLLLSIIVCVRACVCFKSRRVVLYIQSILSFFFPSSSSFTPDDDLVFEDFARLRLKGTTDDKDEDC